MVTKQTLNLCCVLPITKQLFSIHRQILLNRYYSYFEINRTKDYKYTPTPTPAAAAGVTVGDRASFEPRLRM